MDSANLLILAEQYLEVGDLEAARGALEKLLSSSPEHADDARALLAQVVGAKEDAIRNAPVPVPVFLVEQSRTVEEEDDEEPDQPEVREEETSSAPVEETEPAETPEPEGDAERPIAVREAPRQEQPSSVAEVGIDDEALAAVFAEHRQEIEEKLEVLAHHLDHGRLDDALAEVETVLRRLGTVDLANEIRKQLASRRPAEDEKPAKPARPVTVAPARKEGGSPPPRPLSRALKVAAVLVTVLASGLFLLFWILSQWDGGSIPVQERSGVELPRPPKDGGEAEPSPPSPQPVEEPEAEAEQALAEEASPSVDLSKPEPPLPGPQAALGTLLVEASPWARVVAIRRADGSVVLLDDCRYTPCRLRLSAGSYSIELEYEAFPRRTIAAVVQAGQLEIVTERFGELAPDDFLVDLEP